ncbi:unnamed protein product [Linum trigynum]|uniref:Uncharacterized protein n=1 Tax=Linum trigynum TaxID=586398 RepID=A0AAV2DSA0_9ROSI
MCGTIVLLLPSKTVYHGFAASVNANATFNSQNACPVAPAAGVTTAATANPTPTPSVVVVSGNQLARVAAAMVVA